MNPGRSSAPYRAIFAGHRGRLLVGLLLAEFAAAVQGIAYSTVLPLASQELNGSSLYGATLAGTTLATIAVLTTGSRLTARAGPRQILFIATVVFVAGVLMAALAPSMGWVLAGSVVRGVAGGLLAAFGLTAIGGLYSDTERPRVFALFSMIWLLPSFIGPALNAAIALAFGWRLAMAWPAALVLVARLLVARDADLIPWKASEAAVDPVGGALVIVGLTLATAASGAPAAPWSIAVFSIGIGVAGAACARSLRVIGRGRHRRLLMVFTAVCLSFFGMVSLVPLAVVEGMGYGVVAGSLAYAAALVAWSVIGLWHAPLRGAVTKGLILLAVAGAALALALPETFGRTAALILITTASGLAGGGIGLVYPRLSSGAFDDLQPAQVTSMAAAVAFAEIAGTALGALLGGGVYSMAVSAGLSTRSGIGVGLGILTLVGLATVAGWTVRQVRTSDARPPIISG